jgi:5'-3' exonuclease
MWDADKCGLWFAPSASTLASRSHPRANRIGLIGLQALQAEGIECIVAPYEADAQLAFLSHIDYVHCVISEDSDLLPFGCKRVRPFVWPSR